MLHGIYLFICSILYSYFYLQGIDYFDVIRITVFFSQKCWTVSCNHVDTNYSTLYWCGFIKWYFPGIYRIHFLKYFTRLYLYTCISVYLSRYNLVVLNHFTLEWSRRIEIIWLVISLLEINFFYFVIRWHTVFASPRRHWDTILILGSHAASMRARSNL